ncbi:MAG: hypothetical protein AAFV54_16915, partial [Pseudomonadota bacterium]
CCFGKVTSVVVIDVIVVVVAVPVVRHLQAEALLGVEPLHGSIGHILGLLFCCCPQNAATWQSQSGSID